MQITRAGEYGVLGLVHLARRGPDQTVMIDEISRTEKIPKSFLAKIFQNLVKAGLVRSVRGARGGFGLAKDASQITVLDIVEAIEGKINFQRCKEQTQPECVHFGSGCVLCDMFQKAEDGVREVLLKTSLSDLVARQTKIESAQEQVKNLKAAVAH